ncbi:MAG: hypothetical protein IKN04_01755, partial [Clostridia bacterium]|nr:hypothetical protein [Clostridia bacterium]
NSLLIYEAFLFPPILCSNLLIRLLFSLVTEKDTLPFLYQRTFFSDLDIEAFSVERSEAELTADKMWQKAAGYG